jgi:DNA-directed RNA polymerase subunit RPC12/RpoP
MEKSKEKCPECGKKLKFLKKHIKRAHSTLAESKKISGKVQEISSSNFLKEISLKEEYDKMEETINPKKTKEEETKTYKCGSCGGSFKEKIKRCPHCGVEFE